MKNHQCICCGNEDKQDFITLNYSSLSTMHYPKILDDSVILYCKKCNFSFCENHIDDEYLSLYYTKYYSGKSIKSDSCFDHHFIRN